MQFDIKEDNLTLNKCAKALRKLLKEHDEINLSLVNEQI